MSWSGFMKVILGILSAIALLSGGGLIAARVVAARFTAPPPKPSFPNDNKPISTKPVARTTPTAEKTTPPETEKPTEASTPKPLPAGAFQARVTQDIGLIVRDSPSVEGTQVGGIDFNAQVTVLEESADGEWQKIRLSNEREGWVRAGNVEKVTQ
jgi:uncharacterized protein YgiM (DUF1202 family)